MLMLLSESVNLHVSPPPPVATAALDREAEGASRPLCERDHNTTHGHHFAGGRNEHKSVEDLKNGLG